jgi:isoamylase
MSSCATHQSGKSFPLGATLTPGGANFSVFAKHSRAAQLLLFNHLDDAEPSRVIDLDPRINRTYHYWHAFVPGVTAGQLYGYRVAGPFDPARGLRFDPNKLLRKMRCPADEAQPGGGAETRGQRGDGTEERGR